MGRSVNAKMKSIENKSSRDAKKNEARKANSRRGEHGCARLKRLDAQREAQINAVEAAQRTPEPEARVNIMGKLKSFFRR